MMNRKQDRQDMERLSDLLDRMLQGEYLTAQEERQEDTLPAKMTHQMVRLSEQIRGTREALTTERDETNELIAQIAHQMRNPLANMESYTALLEQQCQKSGLCAQTDENAKTLDYLRALRQSEEKLQFLTESFIKMARLEHKIIQIRKESDDLQQTILQAVLLVQKKAMAKQMNLRITGAADVRVAHDANWLSEAVYNLLDNSVKYGPAGSEITICLSQDEMYTRICVQDEGIGIEPEEEGRIFQRFYRGKRVREQNGFGLGLYLTREILLLHGGFVKARRKEKGLEVILFLP